MLRKGGYNPLSCNTTDCPITRPCVNHGASIAGCMEHLKGLVSSKLLDTDDTCIVVPCDSLETWVVAAYDGLEHIEDMVTTSDGTVVGNGNGKFVTDSAGTFTVSGIEPGTTLVVKETRQKEGYILDDVPQTAKISAGQTVTLEFRNKKQGNLIIYKLSSVDKSPLEGAQFKITYANGQVVDAADGKLSSNGLYTTNAEGQIILSNITGDRKSVV